MATLRRPGPVLGFNSTITISAPMVIQSSIASGMLALSRGVFSLAFVMIQFSATAYSPRLLLWISRDPFMWHAVRIFTATFLYAIAALSGMDGNASFAGLGFNLQASEKSGIDPEIDGSRSCSNQTFVKSQLKAGKCCIFVGDR